MKVGPLIPERFGCGSKINFGELVELRRATNSLYGVDATPVPNSSPPSLCSIDRIFTVGVSEHEFCRLAIKHAAADLVCTGARPRSVCVAFEFGPELNALDRQALSRALFEVAAVEGIFVGKCHSTEASTTALTLTVEGPVVASLGERCVEGELLIIGEVGGLQALYRMAMHGQDQPGLVEAMLVDHSAQVLGALPSVAFCTDVSGYGLAGACWEASLALEAHLILDTALLETNFPEVDDPIPHCLLAVLDNYGLPEAPEHLRAVLARRELCGPYLLACPDAEVSSLLTQFTASRGPKVRRLGRFNRGPAGVSLK